MGATRDRPENESARYNRAHPFSHDHSFIPMFEQRSLHLPAGLGRSNKRPPEGDGCRFGFVITERPCPCSSSAHSTRPPGLAVRTNVLRKGTDAGSVL